MRRVFNHRIFGALVIIVDLILVYASILLAFVIFKDSLLALNDNFYAFIQVAPYIGIGYFLLAHIFELDKAKDFSFWGIAYSVTLCILTLFSVTLAVTFMMREFAYPRSVLILGSIFQVTSITLWHWVTNIMYRRDNRKKTILIIGKENAKVLAHKLIESDNMWSSIKHICKPSNPCIKDYIADCDLTFLTEDIDENEKQDIVHYCVELDKQVLYEPRNTEILLFNASITQVDDTPLLHVRPLGLQSANESTKRMLDVIVASLGLIVFIIPSSIVYLCLKISGGTAFFVQERVTRGGKIFKIYKFRTMVENAEAKSGPMLAQNNDNRITRFGHFLRTTRLDETPQIFNILKGDMSIVGPRPERPFFVEQFKQEIPEYELRHRVKAGLTGLAQIQGKYNTTVRDKLKYDLLYINGYSLALDIKLIMQTLNILLRKSSTEGVKEATDIESVIEELYRD